jgi:hypothetical protein
MCIDGGLKSTGDLLTERDGPGVIAHIKLADLGYLPDGPADDVGHVSIGKSDSRHEPSDKCPPQIVEMFPFGFPRLLIDAPASTSASSSLSQKPRRDQRSCPAGWCSFGGAAVAISG